jgi:uncharacterized protein
MRKQLLVYNLPAKQFLVLSILFLLFLTKQLAAQSVVDSKTTELFQSIRSGDNLLLEKLLVNGASANDSSNGYTALMAAALSGTTEQMKTLIKHGANVNYVSTNELCPLWLAAQDWDKLNVLLNSSVNVQQRIRGYSVLVKLAAMPGMTKNMRLLIDKGVDPTKSAPDNYLMYNAATSGDTANLGLVIRSGLNVNDTVIGGDCPLNAALFYRTVATVKMLVEKGADVNTNAASFGLEAFHGFTPLMFAAFGNDKASFYYLLDHGANPNIKSKSGYTALMLLQQAEEDDPAMTKAILDHGAEPAITTPSGNDALHFAMQKGNTASVAILKKYSKK